ncbi:PD-(D/E)XK nuclease family protein [Paraferrimonas haliotis]|uniref:PD-(D/E)XK nuclease superfamily protein n=1 Tax=Paraferrimonas haliotis TaxID=2013866 RepID=A0AA37U1R6_9GAMM|nr:PD-(D/E)XK nuclease family protein [Paraferrimonas haliotis]GLS84686.1 hypothetical protein GCM10007894_26630 [Paraferrimonas haliotis]
MDLQNGLFTSLIKYSASDKNQPKENFVTEAFAWLLNVDRPLRNAFFKQLPKFCKKEAYNPINDLNVAHFGDISTQVNFDGKFPDMVWQSDSFTIVFENKVWAELHHNQLKNYRDYAQKHYKSHCVVVITASRMQHTQKPDYGLCWYQVKNIIDSLSDDKTLGWFRAEFCALLSSLGLLNQTPINTLTFSYYNEVQQIQQQFKTIAESANDASIDWPITQKGLMEKHNASVKSRWGRIGIEFNSAKGTKSQGEWKPGLFCGFVVDPYDHQVEDLFEDGPIVLVSIELDTAVQSIIKMPIYQKLVNELKNTISDNWVVTDRSTESKNGKYNKWRPLMIYMTAAAFFEGTNTVDEQHLRFQTLIKEVQRQIIDCESFEPFCKSLSETTE